jgi:hypothetical protein
MTAATVSVYTFAVYPSNFDGTFQAFLLDVPTTLGQDAAARRAYFAAMARLDSIGFDVEDFTVCAWVDGKPGPLVTAGGLL